MIFSNCNNPRYFKWVETLKASANDPNTHTHTREWNTHTILPTQPLLIFPTLTKLWNSSQPHNALPLTTVAYTQLFYYSLVVYELLLLLQAQQWNAQSCSFMRCSTFNFITFTQNSGYCIVCKLLNKRQTNERTNEQTTKVCVIKVRVWRHRCVCVGVVQESEVKTFRHCR